MKQIKIVIQTEYECEIVSPFNHESFNQIKKNHFETLAELPVQR